MSAETYNKLILEGIVFYGEPQGSTKPQIFKYVEKNLHDADIKIFTVRLMKMIEKNAV